MRHDVDRKVSNALDMARIEAKLGIKSTYYFRIPYTLDVKIIEKILSLGHEIGYHYENLSFCHGNYSSAIKDFEMNLNKLREIYPVKTIAMHGSPLSRWDSRDLWKKYNYKDFGIVVEPYFDIDFQEVLYITDAGRAWNNQAVNRRDNINSKYDFTFQSTEDIIKAISANHLPKQIMINIHPEYWTDNPIDWVTTLLSRKSKNLVKRPLLSLIRYFST